MNTKQIVVGVVIVITLILGVILNPFSINDGGERIVVQRTDGTQFVRFQTGIFYSGFFATETIWPNQISVLYQADTPDLDLEDNGIEIGKIKIMFNDGTTANVKGITQFVLPSDEKEMVLIHNTHRTPQSLVTKRLATFTKECLQSSAQLMSSGKHYGGGRAQMSQDFLDQLRNGVYLSSTEEKIVYDSVEKEKKRLYVTEVKIDKASGQPKRKASAIAEYAISVADASIIDAEYEDKVQQKLAKIIDAATKSEVSRQELMTAQQQALTAKAKGEQELVEIEYKQRQEQTKQVVAAQTKVEVAKQDKLQQQIQYEASILEAKKRREIADVAAYEKRTTIQANGALELKLQTWLMSQQYWADAFGKYTGNVSPQIISGGGYSPGGNNAAASFMEIMASKAAKDLALDMRAK